MKNIPLSKNTILGKIDEIQNDLAKLNNIKELSIEEFRSGENFAIAEHYLRIIKSSMAKKIILTRTL
ncbi:MAG: hypothetical protein AB1498_12975 [bacterium]